MKVITSFTPKIKTFFIQISNIISLMSACILSLPFLINTLIPHIHVCKLNVKLLVLVLKYCDLLQGFNNGLEIP